jgi:hypothetical protein
MPKTTRAACVMAAFLPALIAQEPPKPHYAYAHPDGAAEPAEPSIPPEMHLCVAGCSAGRGSSLVWKDGRYYDGPSGDSTITVEKFTRASVVMRRTDKSGPYHGVAILTGQISGDGNRIVNGKLQWIEHPCCGLTSGPFQAAWGDAINTVPGKQQGNVQTTSAQDQSLGAMSLLIGVLGGGGGGQNDGDAGSGLIGRITSLKSQIGHAHERCAIRRDNQCNEEERLKDQLSDARGELVSEIEQLKEAHEKLEPECRNGNQDSCGKLERVDALLKKDQEFRVRDGLF